MNFTEDWFTPYIPSWREHVLPRLRRHPAKVIEVGSFEGRSAAWLLQNALIDPHDTLWCIDPFTPYEGHSDYEAVFDANMKEIGAGDRLLKIKAESRAGLRRLPHDYYDGIYIDGSHATVDVLRDAVLAFDLVKVGGFILFDDYEFASDPDHIVREAVDAFTRVYPVRLIFQNWQLMVERVR